MGPFTTGGFEKFYTSPTDWHWHSTSGMCPSHRCDNGWTPGTHDMEAQPGDNDLPYTYRTPTVDGPAPFTFREYAHLLMLRSKITEQRSIGAVSLANRTGVWNL